MRGSRISDRSVIGLLVLGPGIMFLLETTNVLGLRLVSSAPTGPYC